MKHLFNDASTGPDGAPLIEPQVLDAFGDLNKSDLIELISEARRIKSQRPFSPESLGHMPLFRPTLGG